MPVESIEPIESSSERRKNFRKRIPRPRSILASRLSLKARAELEAGRVMFPEETASLRPKTRAECVGGPRPCPFVSCKYHLYLDVSRKGSIKLNFPDKEVEEMQESCALDVADRGEANLDEVGVIMNLTYERVRQLEMSAMEKLKESASSLKQHVADGPSGKRHLPVLNNEGPDDTDDENEDEDDIDWGPPIPIDPLDQLGGTDLDDVADLIRSGR